MPIEAVAPRFSGNGVITTENHTYRDPVEGELLVRIGANAICGTDRNEYFNGSPIVPGHEAAGVVIGTGRNTTTPLGTRGAIYLMDYCGACRSCRLGATNQCTAKRADVGQTTDGGYGPYALVHETNFLPVGDDLPLPTATMLLDVMGTSSHALRRAELVRPDIESVYIAGAGPIGLGLLVMTKIRYGADFPVFVSDVSAWRRDLAESLGAMALDAEDEHPILQLQPDMAFDATGKEAARRLALTALGKRGSLVCVGHGQGLTLDVSADLIGPERAVLGSEYFRFDEMADNLQVLLAHQELVSRVITHQFPIESLPEAFALFLSGETGKVVVTQELDS
jgi:threonine dehydrogenase-like Zn-dependent dehydrogenase